MVRLTLKPSWREASCCNLLVVKGAAGLRLRSLRSTLRTDHAAFFNCATVFVGQLLIGQRWRVNRFDACPLAIDSDKARRKFLASAAPDAD